MSHSQNCCVLLCSSQLHLRNPRSSMRQRPPPSICIQLSLCEGIIILQQVLPSATSALGSGSKQVPQTGFSSERATFASFLLFLFIFMAQKKTTRRRTKRKTRTEAQAAKKAGEDQISGQDFSAQIVWLKRKRAGKTHT